MSETRRALQDVSTMLARAGWGMRSDQVLRPAREQIIRPAKSAATSWIRLSAVLVAISGLVLATYGQLMSTPDMTTAQLRQEMRKEIDTLKKQSVARDELAALKTEVNNRLASSERKLAQLEADAKTERRQLADLREIVNRKFPDKEEPRYASTLPNAIIISINADKGELTVSDPAGKEHLFIVSADARIKVAGKNGGLRDLRRGDRVAVEFVRKGSKLVAIEIREVKRD